MDESRFLKLYMKKVLFIALLKIAFLSELELQIIFAVNEIIFTLKWFVEFLENSYTF